MNVVKNQSLKEFNTFNIDAKADYFVKINSKEELAEVNEFVNKSKLPKYILGRGSNTLFTNDFHGVVVKNEIEYIKIINEDINSVTVEVGAGVEWDDFVDWSVKNNYSGIENLSLIPGKVGASPIQNIGAYGVEVKDVFVSCEYVDEKNKSIVLKKNDCNFGYRDSIFKTELKGKFIITSVIFELKKEFTPNISYKGLQVYLDNNKVNNPGLNEVRNAIIAIRNSKLPDTKEFGNAGSFFKNPVISNKEFKVLEDKYSEIPHFIGNAEEVKIPAGWLIEKSGLKGIREGNVGTFKNQALVLVNYGNATGEEVHKLALKIIETVKLNFGIELTPEVNII